MAGNGMKGMNVDEGDVLVGQMKEWMDKVDDISKAVQAIIDMLKASWHGADSTAAIVRFEQILQQLGQLVDLLEAKMQELVEDINEQRDTSGK